MMKKIFIGSGIVFFVLAVVLVALKLQSTSKTTENTSYTVTYKGVKISIPSEQGEVLIDDIYAHPIQLLDNNAVFFSQTQYYHMSFYPQDNRFLISLIDTNVALARKAAEEDFIKNLGITANEACELNVTISVPYNIDPTISGKDYGLSFCPGVNSF